MLLSTPDREEEEARGVLALGVCRGNEGSFRKHTRWDAEGHYGSHCCVNSNPVYCIPHQNHLLFQLSIGICLWTYFPVEVQQLFQWLALTRHDLQSEGNRDSYEADDMHEESREWVTVEHDDKDFLHCLNFHVFIPLFQSVAEGLQVRGVVHGVLLVDNCPRSYRRRHCCTRKRMVSKGLGTSTVDTSTSPEMR
jgi:hypothetical protein